MLLSSSPSSLTRHWSSLHAGYMLYTLGLALTRRYLLNVSWRLLLASTVIFLTGICAPYKLLLGTFKI